MGVEDTRVGIARYGPQPQRFPVELTGLRSIFRGHECNQRAVAEHRHGLRLPPFACRIAQIPRRAYHDDQCDTLDPARGERMRAFADQLTAYCLVPVRLYEQELVMVAPRT